jgi:soluble lytic murein transglycosylase-like protein
MSNWMALRPSSVWRTGLVGIALSVVSSSVWSQEDSRSQQAPSGISQPFAGFDATLAKAADTLLVSGAQPAPPTTGKTNADKAADISVSINNSQQSRDSGSGGQSTAAMRLNLLRPVVDPILRRHGVPADLAAVILVESGGRPDALSPKGARGLWQLMPDTARRYGLRVDETRDDRLDLFSATDAAARYLHDLYAEFGDWKLALAAYNTGEANLGSAILKAHTQDFDQLTSLRMLPLETRNYVPLVLATARLIGLSSTLEESRRPASAMTVFAASNP